MKSILSAFFLCLILNSITAQTWTQKSDIPSGGSRTRLSATAFSINDTASFMIGGLKKSGTTWVAYDDFWKYNASSDTWIQKGNFPGGKKYGNISFVIDSIAYVGLGSNQLGVPNQEFWAYNIHTDAWTQIADFPGNGRVYSSAMTIGSKGYVGSGVEFVAGNPVYLDDFWEYNPILNTWSQKVDYPEVRGGTVAFGIGNKGYMGYGQSPGIFNHDLHEYDPLLNTWILKSGFPTTSIAFGSAVVHQGKAYILGGEYLDLIYTNKVWEYDVDNNTWQQKTSFPGTPRRNAIAFVQNNSIYYGTGQTGASEEDCEDDLWEFSNITSIRDGLINSQSISIYPNPASSIVNIKLERKHAFLNIQLVDLLGQIVLENIYSDQQHISFDINQIQKGSYFISITTEEGKTTQKLVKN